MDRKLLGITSAAIGAMFWASAAYALPVSIELEQTGVGATAASVVASADGVAGFFGGFGSFAFNLDTAIGTPPTIQPHLATTVNFGSITGTGPSTLFVRFTETDLTSPVGAADFISNFTWLAPSPTILSVTFTTFWDSTNTAFGTEHLLSTHTTSVPTAVIFDAAVANITTPFSETIIYQIDVGPCSPTAPCSGTLEAQLDARIPEPASLAIFGSALLGFGLIRRRRNS